MEIHITEHAVARYQERVEQLSDDDARDAILGAGEAIGIAADFGAKCVILGNGARLVLDGRTVITVLPKWRG